MATGLEKLIFEVSMMDKLTGPMNKTMKAVNKFQNEVASGMNDIARGGIGVAGAALALKAMIDPSREINKALGEVNSLGVAQEELQKLEESALSFQNQYGESASEFIRSSYDIQSAIGGLTNGELAEFTNASNILAKGTKADAATVTDYMGTMYGIFEHDAKKMGKAEWVQQLTGQTAAAVQMFKTTGSEMSSAFSTLGANAQSAGVPMQEQLAILGTLQATMSGSEAATKYKSFINGVAKAQENLNLSFTDSQGQMLPMVDILQKLKGKFGETLDVAESKVLKDAFGSDEATALIKALINKTDGLGNSMQSLGEIKGMEKAEKMAKSMVDPLDQATGSAKSVFATLSAGVLEALNPFIAKTAQIIQQVFHWMQENQGLVKALGLIAAGLTVAFGVISGLVAILGAAKIAMAALNLVMAANPVGLIIYAVGALIGVVIAAIFYWDEFKAILQDYEWGQGILFLVEMIHAGWVWVTTEATALWNDLVSMLQETEWGQQILKVLSILSKTFGIVLNPVKAIYGWFQKLMGAVSPMMDKLTEFYLKFQKFKGDISEQEFKASMEILKEEKLQREKNKTMTTALETSKGAAQAIPFDPTLLKDSKKPQSPDGSTSQPLIVAFEKSLQPNHKMAPPVAPPASLEKSRKVDVPAGGISQSFSSQTTYGEQHNYFQNPLSSEELEERLAMQAG